MDIANEIADIVKDIQQMSARYFEAKPHRAVGFDEIKFAVVPDNTDSGLLNQLQNMKIPVEIYEKGNNEQRKQILNETADNMIPASVWSKHTLPRSKTSSKEH